MVIAEADGRIVHCNDAAERHLQRAAVNPDVGGCELGLLTPRRALGKEQSTSR
jgi:hypothetical protein